jgi:hypothetical protein
MNIQVSQELNNPLINCSLPISNNYFKLQFTNKSTIKSIA